MNSLLKCLELKTNREEKANENNENNSINLVL